MIAKFVVKADVNDNADIIEIEKIVATAVANYLADEGHPGNCTVTLKSTHPDKTVVKDHEL